MITYLKTKIYNFELNMTSYVMNFFIKKRMWKYVDKISKYRKEKLASKLRIIVKK